VDTSRRISAWRRLARLIKQAGGGLIDQRAVEQGRT